MDHDYDSDTGVMKSPAAQPTYSAQPVRYHRLTSHRAELETWVATVLVIIVAFVGGLVAGAIVMRESIYDPPAVCHATTEDSPPFDCNYTNGGWYPTPEQGS